MLIATTSAIKAGHHGSDISGEVDNLCVCGTYQRIRATHQTL
jgi:isoquinoline 1-oxidoreductase alpha subunit